MRRYIAIILLAALSPPPLTAADSFPGGMPATPASELPNLRRQIKTGDWNTRIHTVHRLGQMGPAALPELGRAAKDADWQVRFTAAHWLGQQGPEATPALMDSLRSDPCWIVRLTALHWLASFDSDAAPPAVYALRRDPNTCLNAPFPVADEVRGKLARHAAAAAPADGIRIVRSTAAPAEHEMPEEAIAREALKRRQDKVDNVSRLRELESLLAGLPPPRREEPQVTAEVTPEKTQRTEAEVLLAGADSLGPPEDALAPPQGVITRNPAARHTEAGRVEDHGAPPYHNPLPDLLSMLKSGTYRQRARAADELGALGGQAAAAVPELTAALADRSPRVRSSAALALGKIGWAADPAVPRLIKALRDKHPDVRYSASEALARIGSPAAREAFERYLRDEVRRALNK
ncbi:MAG: HEAT repeat domain-containing protein [Elusimicrobiota bacterium]